MQNIYFDVCDVLSYQSIGADDARTHSIIVTCEPRNMGRDILADVKNIPLNIVNRSVVAALHNIP